MEDWSWSAVGFRSVKKKTGDRKPNFAAFCSNEW